MARLSLDELTTATDHAPPAHSLRALIDHHFYLDGWVESGGLSLLMMDALLFVPVVMFAFFYPAQTLFWAGGAVLASLVLFEGYVLWRRHARLKG